MNLDNAANLQAEIMQEVFDFDEQPGQAMAFGASFSMPTFVSKRVLDNLSSGAVVAAMGDAIDPPAPAGAILSTSPGAGRMEKHESDDIALGIGAKAVPGPTDSFDLVVIYQDRKLKNSDMLREINDRASEEVQFVFGGQARARSTWHRRANNPMRMGSSIGHFRVTAGTVGCFANDRGTGDPGILSNNHILAHVNRGGPGDAIWHPARNDGGSSNDRVATLDRFVPIQFGGLPNSVDCAWAKLEDGVPNRDGDNRFDSAGNNVGRTSTGQPADVLPGDYVLKVGRTTGYTQGRVNAINVNNLGVNMGRGAIARFDGQIQIESLSRVPYSRGGDSGSLIVNAASEPVGLLFAGSDAGGFDNMGLTWANPIDTVLNELEVEIAL
ncbi:MAG: hypothetical protein AAF414_21150 [Pseudomonadota bacterium]